MTISELHTVYAKHPNVEAIIAELKHHKQKTQHLLLTGLHASAQAMLLASVFQKSQRTMLIVAENAENAAYLKNDLDAILNQAPLLSPPQGGRSATEVVSLSTPPVGGAGGGLFRFPSSYRIRQRHHKADEAYAIERTETLNALSRTKDSNACIVVSYPEALAEAVVQQATFAENTMHIQQGEEMGITALQDKLLEAGFNKVDFVYEPGQFSIRGGIVDIFSFSRELPVRVDFFGDEIDSIRIFDIETQLSKEKLENVDIIPKLTAPLNPPHWGEDQNESEDLNSPPVGGAGGGCCILFDYLPADTLFVSTDFGIMRHKWESSTDVTEALREQLLHTLKEQFTTLELAQKSFFANHSKVAFNTVPQPLFHKNFDLLLNTINQYTAEDYHIYILSDSKKQTDRIAAILNEMTAPLNPPHWGEDQNESEDLNSPPMGGAGGGFIPIDRTLHAGFIDHDAKMCCLTDHEIFERFHKVQHKADTARQGKVLLTLKELNQLQVGDYVVHIDHGIGKFGGLVHTTVNGKSQEMIKLIYRDNDILFVSIHSLHRISKYKGREGDAPNVSKLGSGQWERMKERTKSKVKDIARDLIKLYAQRKAEKGFAYSPDSYLQRELEASFLYEDTPDQQKATLDFKHDMESPMPMDRLICGDVGFGKTEIAMRAAFKAVTDSKQVAVLVPTTVLALQHYNTFRERFKNFPVKIEYLSRAKSPKQVKEVLQQLAEGKIDILIGTHKLVGKSVVFKDLGLLIIDEEQKFGVATKEKLRTLKANVDTLTLTATPIPRTLQFSLLGARDLSVMTTPPPNRYPVQTEIITPDDEDIMQEAIRLEMGRNGQVFVINNLVQNLETIRNKIQRLVPEARIAIAHGQMPTGEMEERLEEFINYDYDVLVATSIIEAGVDIPNVNTIIINSAHRFGLSDLHQLRGRVGRSNRKAFCYLVAPPNEILTTDARRRLQAVETFAELGSGFHIAMQDLDIRGAGNMLGAEQSGFIADLGYETYQRILNEAVAELRQEEFADLFEDEGQGTQDKGQAWVNDSQLDTDLEIGFPEEYVENISERITLYRELDGLPNEDALLAFKKRLIDRFGMIPDAGEELLTVVRLRWLCIRLGIERIMLKQGKMTLFFPSNNNSPYYQSPTFTRILTYVVNNPKRCLLREQENGKRSVVIGNVTSVREAYDILTHI